MKTLNRVALIGNLSGDVEFSQLKSDVKLSVFHVVTNRNVKGDDGILVDHADFHRIKAWGNLAEISHKYLAKGLPVYIEGKLVNNNFETEDGKKLYRNDIHLDNLYILKWKKDKSGVDKIELEDVASKK